MGAFGNIVTRIKAVISADNKDFKKKMKATRADTKKTGKSIKDMGNVVKGVMAGVVVAAVAKGIKALLNIGKSLDLMSIKATAVFGLYRKDVEGMADDTASSMGLTKTEFMNAAAGIQDLLIPIGFARKEATGMTKEMMGLAGALSTWTGGMYSAKEVGDIFAKAMLGEREQLKALGIAISESEIQLELAAKGMKHLTGESLAQAKAQITMELITRKSTDAQEAFNTAQDTLVVTMAKTGANIRTMGENLAIILNPALREGAKNAEKLTSQFGQILEDGALIASSDVLTTWEKWQYRLAGLTGGVGGMAKQMQILGIAMSETDFDAMVDEIVRADGTIAEVEKTLEQFGQSAVEHGKKYYDESKKLRERDLAEQAAAEQKRLAEQQATWDAELAAYREKFKQMAEVAAAFDKELFERAELTDALTISTEGLNAQMAVNAGLTDKMPESIGAATVALGIYDTAARRVAETTERVNTFIASNIDWQGVEQDMLYATADAAIYAAKQEEASFASTAKAAIQAGRDILGAAIVRGVASAVASALEEVAFPWNILAAAAAGAGAAILFETIVPSFAEGGMVTGPTMAMVGDNPSGKELIIPWEKVGDLGGGLMAMDGIVRGRDLHLMGKRYNEKLTKAGRI